MARSPRGAATDPRRLRRGSPGCSKGRGSWEDCGCSCCRTKRRCSQHGSLWTDTAPRRLPAAAAAVATGMATERRRRRDGWGRRRWWWQWRRGWRRGWRRRSRHTWRTPRRLLWFGGGGEDSHVRTAGLSVLNWRLCANPTSLAERHAAAGGVRRPRGTAANPILRYRMGPHGGPSAAENVACWGLSCVTPLARRVKLAPVCDQPQPRQAPPGRWGCEAAG